ncbi:MAG: hypothetical protein KatS3mg071_2747 [Meiothermus sp.]|nr:MAG: hypothetical protein KatS3mg071_2747 [Meiothermus sp.]
MNEKTLLWILAGVVLGTAGYLGYTYLQSTRPQPEIVPVDTTRPPQLSDGWDEYRRGEIGVPVGTDAPLTDAEKELLQAWTVPTPEN